MKLAAMRHTRPFAKARATIAIRAENEHDENAYVASRLREPVCFSGRRGMKQRLSIGLAGAFVIASGTAFAQVPLPDQSTLQRAHAALAAAEKASREAKASADLAQEAARTADAQLIEARRLMAALTTGAPPAPAAIAVREVREDLKLVEKCPDSSGDVRGLAYFKAVADCERRVLAGSKVNAFKARSATGFGTSIVAAQAGASATVTLEGVSNWRSVFSGTCFPDLRYSISSESRASVTPSVFAPTLGRMTRSSLR